MGAAEDPWQAARRQELKGKVSTAKILSSGWWWLVGGFYGIIWLIGYFNARSTLKSFPAAGFGDLQADLKKAKKRARNNLILLAVIFSLYICISAMSASQ